MEREGIAVQGKRYFSSTEKTGHYGTKVCVDETWVINKKAYCK